MGPLWIFVLFAVVAGAVAYFAYLAKKKRRLAFASMAKQLGFQYAITDPFNTLAEPFALFGKGEGRGVENVIWGTWNGMETRVFDYWYYEESTDSKGNRSRTYYRFDCALAPIAVMCSHLTIDHENFFTRMADHLSFRDIEFENEEFNKKYNIKCQDKKFANDFVDARMIDFLMLHGQGYSFEVATDRMLVACKKIDPVAIIPLMGTMKAFVDQVPKVVFSLYPKAG